MFLAAARPTIGQLNKFVIPNVGHRWRNLGVKLLGVDEAERLTGGNQKRCSEILRIWLDRNPNADWYQLVEALDSPRVQLSDVAGEIRNMFTGEI